MNSNATMTQKTPAKKVIKLTYTQAQEMLKEIKTCSTQYLPRPTVPSNTPPLTLKKTCGLFNDENLQLDIDKDKDTFNLNQSDFINDANEMTIALGETQTKFTKKLQSLNMKIKVPPVNQYNIFNTNETNVLDLMLTEEEWNQLIKNQDQLIDYGNDFNQSNGDEDDSSLKNLVCDTAAIEKALLDTDVFASDLINAVAGLPDVSEKALNHDNNALLTDHVYSNKRSSSFLDDTNNQDSYSCPGSVSPSGAKKQRTRGIYRLDDVTNEEEFQNYLERRKKNNISSKASRANKKNLYNEMDVKSDFLVIENQRLSQKIVKMQDLIKIVTDYARERFAGK